MKSSPCGTRGHHSGGVRSWSPRLALLLRDRKLVINNYLLRSHSVNCSQHHHYPGEAVHSWTEVRTRYLLKVKLFFLSILKCTLKSEAFLFFPTFNYAFELISIWIGHALCDWHVVTVASVTSSQDTKCHLPKFCSQHKTNGQTNQ